MEGGSRNGRRIRVHREFESSRLEEAMLAAAYHRILPSDRLKLVERRDKAFDRGDREVAPAPHDDTNCSLNYATAMGGP